MRLGVIYDFQATNRKQGELSAITPLHPGAFLLVAWESFKPPSRSDYTKTSPQIGGCYYFLIEKSPKTTFL
jgi:hypothetical protein